MRLRPKFGRQRCSLKGFDHISSRFWCSRAEVVIAPSVVPILDTFDGEGAAVGFELLVGVGHLRELFKVLSICLHEQYGINLKKWDKIDHGVIISLCEGDDVFRQDDFPTQPRSVQALSCQGQGGSRI
jgi:hypothetical protein